MTRLARYQLCACPKCSKIFKHPLWASISVNVPRSVNPHLVRECTRCGYQAPLAGWRLYDAMTTKEEFGDDDLIYERLMVFFGQEKQQKIMVEKNVIKRMYKYIFGRSKINPENFPEIKILG